MADRICTHQQDNPYMAKESACIHTKKIFDSCKDKDCIEDLRVYTTACSQAIIDSSFSVRPKSATLIHANVRVEDINFNKGCYTVDVTFFYKIVGETFPHEKCVTGLAIFDKRVILYGSEGNSKIFSSNNKCRCSVRNSSLPTAVVETVDPLALSMKIVDNCPHMDNDNDAIKIPKEICDCFDDEILTCYCGRRLLVTLGQFSIIRLERDTQLLLPIFDYCIPDKECVGGEEDPCMLFSNIPFPVDDFFPPKQGEDSCFSNGTCGK